MAINCLQILSGLAKDCTPNKGGIKAIYIANFDEVESITMGTDIISGDTISSNIISDIAMSTSKKFKKYSFRQETGSLTSTLTTDKTTGGYTVTNDISLVFTKMETVKRIEIAALSLGELAAIVEDENGKYWYVGKDNPLTASAGSANSGTARGDSNNYSITLQSMEDEFPYEVSADAVSKCIG